MDPYDIIIGQQCIVRGTGGRLYLGTVKAVVEQRANTFGVVVRGGEQGESTYALCNVEFIDPRKVG